MKYYLSREATRILGVCADSLRKWADTGEMNCIRTQSGQRRYDVDSYIGKSTTQNQYPTAEFVRDASTKLSAGIGSGLNFKRKGLKTLLERAMSGTHITLVVAH